MNAQKLIVPFEEDISRGLMDIDGHEGVLRVHGRGGSIRILIGERPTCVAGKTWGGNYISVNFTHDQARAIIMALSAAIRNKPIIPVNTGD